MTTHMLTRPRRLNGTIAIPGDKSVSHRAILFNALADGSAAIQNFLPGADCLSSIACMRAMGVTIEQQGTTVHVHGVGLHGLREPTDLLDCGNSGTTLRLLAGLLAGMPFFSVLSGDASLRSRPQRRVVEPLRALGASIDGRAQGDRAPLAIRGTVIHGGEWELTVASAQVKSALLLAALSGDAPLRLHGRIDSRDHTERMLSAMGVALQCTSDQILLTPPTHLTPLSLEVPGDPSSAAFWWVAAAIHPAAEVTTTGVCLNPTRTGALDVLQAMGANITISKERIAGNEPVGDVTVRSSHLHATEVGGAIIPRLIDEIPILSLAAACAAGTTTFYDAQELRAKETDRIATVVAGLHALGVAAEARSDGLVVRGHAGATFKGATLASHNDHRLAMTWAVAALIANAETHITDADAVAVSYPTFWDTLQDITSDVHLSR